MNTEPKRTISFSPPDMSELEINEVADCLRSGWITTGPRTKKLEKELKEYVGADGLVCLNSATASEELSLRILGNRVILGTTGKISDFSRVCGY